MCERERSPVLKAEEKPITLKTRHGPFSWSMRKSLVIFVRVASVQSSEWKQDQRGSRPQLGERKEKVEGKRQQEVGSNWEGTFDWGMIF